MFRKKQAISGLANQYLLLELRGRNLVFSGRSPAVPSAACIEQMGKASRKARDKRAADAAAAGIAPRPGGRPRPLAADGHRVKAACT